MKPLIDCNTHDYFEIACMYHYNLNVITQSGRYIEGRALDLITRDGREWLSVESKDQVENIELNQIETVEVLSPHARFNKIAC